MIITKLPKDNSIRILLISDIHGIVDNNYIPCGGPQYINTFGSSAVDLLQKLKSMTSLHYDMIVNVGDTIKDSNVTKDTEVFSLVVDLLSTFDTQNIIHVIGNHDIQHINIADMCSLLNRKEPFFSSTALNFKHIVLFAYTKNHQEAVFGSAQLAWLEHELSRNGDMPTIIYSHFPFIERDLEKNYYFLKNPKSAFPIDGHKVQNILENHPNVILSVNGHLHFYDTFQSHGIQYLTVPSLTENNGNHQPLAQVLLVTITDKHVQHERIDISI